MAYDFIKGTNQRVTLSKAPFNVIKVIGLEKAIYSDTTKLILTYQSKKITIEKNAISLWDIFQSMTFLIDNPIELNISFQPPNTFKID